MTQLSLYNEVNANGSGVAPDLFCSYTSVQLIVMWMSETCDPTFVRLQKVHVDGVSVFLSSSK